MNHKKISNESVRKHFNAKKVYHEISKRWNKILHSFFFVYFIFYFDFINLFHNFCVSSRRQKDKKNTWFIIYSSFCVIDHHSCQNKDSVMTVITTYGPSFNSRSHYVCFFSYTHVSNDIGKIMRTRTSLFTYSFTEMSPCDIRFLLKVYLREIFYLFYTESREVGMFVMKKMYINTHFLICYWTCFWTKNLWL